MYKGIKGVTRWVENIAQPIKTAFTVVSSNDETAKRKEQNYERTNKI